MAEATKKRSLCKACGAAMEIAPGSAVITCSGCGKKYKLPAKPGESSKPAAAAAAVAAKPPASSGARRAAAVAAPAARPTDAPDADENGGGDADAAGEEAAGAPAVAAKGADGAASKGDKAAAINAAASKRMRRVAASFGIDAPKEGEVPVSDEEKAVAEKKSLKKKLVAILTILILTPIFVGIAVYQRLRQPEPAKPKPPEERTIIQRDFKKDLKDCEKLRDEAWECRKVAMIELRDDLPAKEAKLKEGIAAAERAKKILADAIDSVKNEPDRATNYAYLDDAMKESEAVCKSLTEILTTKPVEPEKPKAGVPMPDKKDPEKKDGDKKDGDKKDAEKKDAEKKEGEKKEGETKTSEPAEPEKKNGDKPAGETGAGASAPAGTGAAGGAKPDGGAAPPDDKQPDEKKAEEPKPEEKKADGGTAPPK